MYRKILIIADIEGSSGCRDYEGSSFLTPQWRSACVELSKDLNSVVTALFDAGVTDITIKDFHRTGYNILRNEIDGRVRLLRGYRRGAVPGFGDPPDAEALMFIGMHAPSGSNGFLAHTLTSRISRLEVNGSLLSEIDLFAGSLAPYNIVPVFFSGCPVACEYALKFNGNINTCAIDKACSGGLLLDIPAWRNMLARSAVESLFNRKSAAAVPRGPFSVRLFLRDGAPAARRLASRWSLPTEGDIIAFSADTFDEMYHTLIRICYLTPFTERILPLGLPFYNATGMAGLFWVRFSS